MELKYLRASYASRRDPYHIVDFSIKPIRQGTGPLVLRATHNSLCKRWNCFSEDEIDEKKNINLYDKYVEEYNGIPDNMIVCGHCLKALKKLDTHA